MSLLTQAEITAIEQAHKSEGFDCWTFNHRAIADAREAAVIKRLSEGVSVEPEAFLREHNRGEIDPYYSRNGRPHPDYLVTPLYFEYQLTTAIAAARVQALEEAADYVQHEEDGLPLETLANGIRALIGGNHGRV